MGADQDTFSHVRHFFDGRFPHEIAQILPGEFYVSKAPKVVYTVLGSCISACILDPVSGIGGMNHFMLPEPKGEGGYDSWGESARYGSYAMELLINEIMKRGGVRKRLEVKLFGGATLKNAINKVGQKNAAWAKSYLELEDLNLVSCDVGDVFPRKVYYFTDSGRVLMKKIKKKMNTTVTDRERAYKKRIDREARVHEKPTEDVTLF